MSNENAKPRIPEVMIERLLNVLRRLDAMTDPDDESCSIKANTKTEIEPYVRSWVAPDVKALHAWATGALSTREAENHFGMSYAPAKKTKVTR